MNDSLKSSLAVVGRLLLALIFITSGFAKLGNLDGTAGYASATGPVADEAGSFTATARVRLDSALTHSWGACAPPPRGPRPSIVVTPGSRAIEGTASVKARRGRESHHRHAAVQSSPLPVGAAADRDVHVAVRRADDDHIYTLCDDGFHVSGLLGGAARHMPAPASVPRDGLKIGASTFPGDERQVAIHPEQTVMHTWVVGPTGSGKTVLLDNIAQQLMEHNRGFVLVETKRDLFNRVLNNVPRHRLDDVIVLDVEDAQTPVGFNLLTGNPFQVIDDLESIVSNIHGDDKGVWFREVIYFGLQTLMMRPGATISDLPALLSPRFDEVEWRDELINSVKDPELAHFWQRLDNQGPARRDQIVAPVLSRFWQFNRPQLRANFAQRNSAFTMEEVVQGNKILLVNLTGVDKATTQILGSVIVNALRHEVWKGRLPQPYYLIADEVQNITHLPIGLNGLLDQARGFNLGLVMANQAAHQLPTHIRQAVQSNARSKVAFQMESDDAKLMAQMMGGGLTEHDFMNLRNYDAYARVAIDGGVSPPMSIHPPAPGAPAGTAQRVRDISRRNYGRPLSQVEAEIQSWRKPSEEAKEKRRRPRISGDDWAN